jgi:hypothetical protein
MSQSKQRVFSNKDLCDYKDYLKLKSGEIMLKNIKSKVKNPNPNLNRFNNYQEFLNATKAYYKYKNLKCTYQLLKDIYNTNSSFILCKPIIEHINDCDCCCDIEKKEVELYPLFIKNIKCNKLSEIINTYGLYKSQEEANIYFPNCINIQNWCNYKKPDPCVSYNEFIDINIQNNFGCLDKKKEPSMKSIKIDKYDLETNIYHFSNNDYKQCGASFKSKYGLFKNTKPLFI